MGLGALGSSVYPSLSYSLQLLFRNSTGSRAAAASLCLTLIPATICALLLRSDELRGHSRPRTAATGAPAPSPVGGRLSAPLQIPRGAGRSRTFISLRPSLTYCCQTPTLSLSGFGVASFLCPIDLDFFITRPLCLMNVCDLGLRKDSWGCLAAPHRRALSSESDAPRQAKALVLMPLHLRSFHGGPSLAPRLPLLCPFLHPSFWNPKIPPLSYPRCCHFFCHPQAMCYYP